MSLASRRKLLLRMSNGENDNFDWSNRVGYFNTSYTVDNGWWLNGNYDSELITAMENLNSGSYTKRRYFFMWFIDSKWRMYISDYPFYVTYNDAKVSKYWIVHARDATQRFIDGTLSNVNFQYYDTRDAVIYSKDHSARSQEYISTIISNYPIFDWADEVPSIIPIEGGAIRLY